MLDGREWQQSPPSTTTGDGAPVQGSLF